MISLTRELDDIVRQCEMDGIRTAMQTARRLQLDTGVASIDVAGGLVAFTGRDSPLSQAYGVGVETPADVSDVNRITNFYESRGAVARVLVSPLGDASFGRALAAGGYAPREHENILASDFFEFGRRDDRVGVSTDLDAWAVASAQAFLNMGSAGPGDLAVAQTIAQSDGVTALEAREDGAIAATAAMDLCRECAGLFAGSVLPAFRGRGLHLAMLRDRIARARDAGARLMRGTAKPGSVSERNFHRCGFVTLYTRTLWERTPLGQRYPRPG